MLGETKSNWVNAPVWAIRYLEWLDVACRSRVTVLFLTFPRDPPPTGGNSDMALIDLPNATRLGDGVLSPAEDRADHP